MEANWFNQLLLLGALQGLILAMVIWRKKYSNKAAANALGILLLMTSLVLVGRVFYETEFLNRFWAVYTFSDVIIFSFGPIIYLFTHALLKKKFPPWTSYRWHFLPTLIHLLIFTPIISLTITGSTTSINVKQIFFIYKGLEFFAIISLIIYSWKSIRLYLQYESEYYNSFSYPILSAFLKTFLYFFLILSLVWLVAFILRLYGHLVDQDMLGYYWFWTIAAISTYMMSYKVLFNPEALHLIREQERNTPTIEIRTPEVSVETTIDQSAKGQLISLLQSSKIYKNPKLSLDELAHTMQLSRHELSKTINQGFHKSFFDLINSYRIQEFIEVYQGDKQLTFLEVAYSVGFNSKSAFNRAFRKETGTSPSDYFKQELAKK